MSIFDKIFRKDKQDQILSDEEKYDSRQIDELVATLADVKFSNTRPAADTLARIGNPAVGPLVAAMQNNLKDARTANALVKNAANTLVKIGGPAVEPLIATLQSTNEDALFWAARALGNIGDANAIEPLFQLHENTPSRRVRNAAGMSLGKLGDPRAISTVVSLLKIDNWIREVKEILIAFGPAAVEPIVASLQNISEGNTYTSAKANHITVLSTIGDARAVDVLKSQTSPEKDAKLRNLALEALSKTGHKIEMSQDEITDLRVSLLANSYDERKTALAQARTVSSSVGDPQFQRAFQASEKIQMAFDNQRKALTGIEPMQACHDAIELEPDFSAAYVCLSYLYREYVNKPNDALGWIEKAIQIDPQNPWAWTELGMVHVAQGDVLEATRAFQKVVTLAPQHENLEPRARLAIVYRTLDIQYHLGGGGLVLDPDQESKWERLILAADNEQLRRIIE